MFRWATGLSPDADDTVETCEEAFECDEKQEPLSSTDEISIRKTVDCETALAETEDLLLRFLRNSYSDAIEEISARAPLHFAYAQGKSNFLTLKAIVTLDPDEIEAAMKACQYAIDESYAARKKQSWISSWFWRFDTNDYTDEEIHAELGYAETTIIMALLICITERTIIGLVKAGLKLQSAMGAFLECRRILKERSKYCSDESKAHFESGVRMGIGAYNVITSHLPDRILRLVSFMGMGGNRSYGLRQMEKAAFMDKGIRAPLSGLGLLAYHIKVEFLLGLGEVDFDYVKKLMDHMSGRIEGSALLILFEGMYQEALGKPDDAIKLYESAMGRINSWVQAHHGCHWLILWCHAVQHRWSECTGKIKLLLDECKWSPATFNYMYSMFLYMEQERKHGHANHVNFDPEVKEKIAEMMRKVPILRHRIAGKTVHLEKFVELRSYLYFNENESMLLPILDMFYLWNIFPMIQKNTSLIEPFLSEVEEFMKTYTAASPDEIRHRYYYLVFFKGVCLRYMGQIDSAITCFRDIIACEHDIREYTHLPPHACLELGLAYRKLGDLDEAKFWLNKSINEYSNYMNATTVHIRAHTALTIIRTAEGGEIANVYDKMEEHLKAQALQNKEGILEVPVSPDSLATDAAKALSLDPSLAVEDLS